jgi:RNA polymerase sigma-70 factor (ECF subfamily)
VATDSSFEAAFARACQGSEEDLRQLLHDYGAYIQRVVRSRLDMRLRPKFDSLDFVQMVWASFFAEPGALLRFNNPKQLLKYLAIMARHKVVDEERRRLSDNNRYRATGEQFLGERDSEVAERRSDSPSQCAIARERLQLLESTNCQQEREIMRLRMKGLSYIEIASKLNINERTVRKIVDRLLE